MIMIQGSADRKCTVNKLNSRWTLYQNKFIKKLYLNWRGVISSDPFKRRHNCGYKYICTSVQVKLLHASMSITLLSFYRAIKFDARLSQACSNFKSKYTYFIGMKILVMFCSVHFKLSTTSPLFKYPTKILKFALCLLLTIPSMRFTKMWLTCKLIKNLQ